MNKYRIFPAESQPADSTSIWKNQCALPYNNVQVMGRKSKEAAAVLGILWCGWWVSAPFGGRAMLQLLDASHPRTSIDSCPHADAVVVLSGDGSPRIHVPPHALLRRSEAGLALINAGKAPYVVFTDGGLEGEASRVAAIREGVSFSDILVVRPARTTENEARLIAHTAAEKQWRRLILVTSGYHMARAKRLLDSFIQQDGRQIEVVPFVADSGEFFIKMEPRREYLPSSLGIMLSLRATREFLDSLGV